MIGSELDETIKYIKNRLAFVDNIRKLLKDRVESNITSLFETNLDLQQRVYHRTIELNEANKKLQEEISERKQIEEALRESEKRYKKLLNAATDYIYTMEIRDAKIVKTTHNAGCMAVTGYTFEEFHDYASILYKIVHDRDCSLVKEYMERMLKGEYLAPIEYRIIHKNGSIRWVRNRIVPRFDGDGRLIECDGLITDITERKLAEEALKQSEKRFKSLVDATTDYIYTINIDNNKIQHVRHGPACVNVTGYKSMEFDVHARLWYNIIHMDDQPNIFKLMSDILVKPEIFTIEHRIINKNGSTVWVKNTLVPRFDSNGSCIGYDGLITDITVSKKAQEALETYNMELEKRVKERAAELLHAKNYLESVLSSMSDILIVVNAEHTIQIVNNAACKLLGFDETELVGKKVNCIFDDDILEIIKSAQKDGQSKDNFNNAKTKYSEEVKFLLNVSRFEINSDETIIVGHDMREIKKLEDEAKRIQLKLLTSSKMATLGEIATGIAHEINQPLTYISSYIQGLLIDVKHDSLNIDNIEKEAKISFKQVERISEIIRHLLTFGRRDDIDMRAVSVESIFNNTMLLMRERLRLKNISLSKEIEPDVPTVLGNENQLEQVFINILQNAVDAFKTKETKAPEIKVQIGFNKDTDNVFIKFIDNGPGIYAKILDKIFEPFFTTKEVGKGTGLGLSIAYGIIREHNGIIACESELDRGAVFTIKIPVGY